MSIPRTITAQDMRSINRSAILETIRREGPISRNAIADRLDVSLPTVMRVVDDLVKEAESAAAGSEGLLFLPYLSGERTPHPDPLARGAFVGLTLRHSRAHMTRAVLEGVAFGLKDILTLIQNTGLGPITQVRASGGGAKGALWRQILASVLEADLVTVNTSEGAAFGAALLAGVGAGAWPEVTYACRESIHITGQTLPSNEQVDVYHKIYPLYHELYPALRSTSGKLSTL